MAEPWSHGRLGRTQHRTSRDYPAHTLHKHTQDMSVTAQQPSPLSQQQGSEKPAQPPTCPKIALQNDQLPELGASGRKKMLSQ